MCIFSLSCGDYGAQIQSHLGAKAVEGCKIKGMLKQVVGKCTEFFFANHLLGMLQFQHKLGGEFLA